MTTAALSRSNGIPLKYANRHGLITGQTGTGKTVSLMRLAESFSANGVPVMVSDVKGDIAALSRSCPSNILDVFGQTGQPLKVTVSAMGPDLMARALELTDTQAGCLEIAFAYAADKRTSMHTLDDLRAVLSVLETDKSAAHYGRVSSASIGVIYRALLRLEMQGGRQFFGSPCFDVARLMEIVLEAGDNGWQPRAGIVSILDSVRLVNSPRVYGAFLLWLLSDLWERLPEIGDCDKPRLVMFFDEAHLLFQDCPAPLLRRIEQTVRLIRSKGVGIYFVSQSPDDIPAAVREQLAFRVRHSRELKIGQADFSGIDQNGRPFAPRAVQVDLPDCPLGALSPLEQMRSAPMPESSQATATAAPAVSFAVIAGASLAIVALGIWAFTDSTWIPVGLGLAAAALTTKPG